MGMILGCEYVPREDRRCGYSRATAAILEREM